MIEIDSLDDLPMAKRHTTPGDVPRDSTAAYLDLDALVREDEHPSEAEQATEATVAEVYADE